ncbi:hypothetical protein [Klebsiella pneumoniae]|uniref:hypothetical protein n=1 Tax=Klebsiella pneumoniae TaxID=573 RepID=UPI001E34DFA8|nr:hypothetical protein [Klebsiella pneumoniae]
MCLLETIEALTPQDIDKEMRQTNPVYKVGAGSMLPDDPEHTRKDIAPAKCGATPLRRGLSSERDFQMLEDKIGAHEAVPEERKSGKCRLLILVSMKKASPASHVRYPCQHGRRLRYSGMIAAFMLFMLFAPMCPTAAPNDSLPLVDSGFDFDNLTLHPCSGWTMRLIDYRRRDRRPIQDG